MCLRLGKKAPMFACMAELGMHSEKENHDIQSLQFGRRLMKSTKCKLVAQAYEIEKKENRQWQAPFVTRFEDMVDKYKLDKRYMKTKDGWNTHIKKQMERSALRRMNTRLTKSRSLKGFYPKQNRLRIKPYLTLPYFRGHLHIVKARLGMLALNQYAQAWNGTDGMCPMCGRNTRTLHHGMHGGRGGKTKNGI